MKSDGSGGGIPPNSYVAGSSRMPFIEYMSRFQYCKCPRIHYSKFSGRKRRGSGSALDDFLHDRMAKMQQRGDTNSGVNQKAGHGMVSILIEWYLFVSIVVVSVSAFMCLMLDLQENPGTPLLSLHNNSFINTPSDRNGTCLSY